MKYIIKNRLTGLQVGGLYKSKKAARKRVDMLDNAYGAYVHIIKEVVYVEK